MYGNRQISDIEAKAFERLWEEYPIKDGKQKARDAFLCLGLHKDTKAIVHKVLERRKSPATREAWLCAARWP